MLIAGIDFESTGLDPFNDRIVEIGIQVMELETGNIRLSFERKVNPGMHISPGAVAVHGITDADVIRAPKFSELTTGIVALLGTVDLLVAHNGRSFDLPLLLSELERAGALNDGVKIPPLFDTMREGRFTTFDGKVPSLEEFCFAMDVEYDPTKAHAALYDVEVMNKAFRRGYQLGWLKLPGITSNPAQGG